MNIEQQVTELLVRQIINQKGFLDYESIMYYLGVEEDYAKTIVNLLTLKELANEKSSRSAAA